MLPEAMLPLASSAPLSTVDAVETSAPSDEPANMDAVLKMLELEMERARLESQRLQELDAVNQQVVVLTTELEEKTVELEDMRQVKKTMETVVEERSESGGKTLTMADSVLVGDALFGSTKIDSQIINDPLAIARAAIDAYREGKKDGMSNEISACSCPSPMQRPTSNGQWFRVQYSIVLWYRAKKMAYLEPYGDDA